MQRLIVPKVADTPLIRFCTVPLTYTGGQATAHCPAHLILPPAFFSTLQ